MYMIYVPNYCTVEGVTRRSQMYIGYIMINYYYCNKVFCTQDAWHELARWARLVIGVKRAIRFLHHQYQAVNLLLEDNVNQLVVL